jgi:hypothetical protein
MTMTHVEYTDPAVMVPGMTDGLNSWMPLTDDQRHGWACIACGANRHGMRPVGGCDDGQVFLCVDCHDLWASDVPKETATTEAGGTTTDVFDVVRGALHARNSHAYCTPDCDGPTDYEDADAHAVVAALRQRGLVRD